METEFRQIQQMFEHLQTNNRILHEKLNRFIGYNDTLTEVGKNMNGLVHTTAIAVAKIAILHEKMDTEIKNINVVVHTTAVATNGSMNAIAKNGHHSPSQYASSSNYGRNYQDQQPTSIMVIDKDQCPYWQLTTTNIHIGN